MAAREPVRDYTIAEPAIQRGLVLETISSDVIGRVKGLGYVAGRAPGDVSIVGLIAPPDA